MGTCGGSIDWVKRWSRRSRDAGQSSPPDPELSLPDPELGESSPPPLPEPEPDESEPDLQLSSFMCSGSLQRPPRSSETPPFPDRSLGLAVGEGVLSSDTRFWGTGGTALAAPIEPLAMR